MRIKPSDIWAVSLGLFYVLWLLFPQFFIPLSIILIIHFILLIRGIVDIKSQFFGKVYYQDKNQSQSIAITFDDGPDPELTPDILSLLKEYGFTATFFVVAKQVEKNREIVKQAFQDGHTIACHDLFHAWYSNFRLESGMIRDIGLAQGIIQSAIGKRPLLYRPPIGLMNPHVLPAIREFNMKCIGWSTSAHDKGNRDKKALARIPSLARSGNVIMLHDILPKPEFKELFLNNLRLLFDNIRKAKLQVKTVDDLFSIPAYKDEKLY
jgi:peptidoglycan-N-acetylglucosamine deacetylase